MYIKGERSGQPAMSDDSLTAKPPALRGSAFLEAEKNNRIINNSWVVPYCPYLSLRYNAHTNVEIYASTKPRNIYINMYTKEAIEL